MFGPDFTTEGTELTETDRKEKKGSEPDPRPFLSGLRGLCGLNSGSRSLPSNRERIVVSTYAVRWQERQRLPGRWARAIDRLV